MKLFSIVTVCKNASLFIEDTIKSVITQSYKDYEFIMVDGDSRDGTKQIIEKYKDYIDTYISEKDSGIYQAMNKGILLSKGKYLLFLNAGDTFSNPGVLSDVVGLEKDEDIIIGRIVSDHGFIKPEIGEKINHYFLFCKSPPHQASFIKRDLFKKIGMYKESMAMSGDYDFFLRALIRNNCTFKQIDLVVCYFKPGGISQRREYSDLAHSEGELARRENFGLIKYCIYKLRCTIYLCFSFVIVRSLKKLCRAITQLLKK